MNPTISDFRDLMWTKVRELATEMPSDRVISALERASNNIWQLGLDESYRSVTDGNIDLAGAFDLTWLTAWMLELKGTSLLKLTYVDKPVIE